MDKKRQQWELIKNNAPSLASDLLLVNNFFGKPEWCDIKLLSGKSIQIGVVSYGLGLDYKRVVVNSIDRLIKDLMGSDVQSVRFLGEANQRYGISLTMLSDYRNEDVELQDLKLLSKSEAYDLYVSDFYFKTGIECLPEQLQPVVMDMIVDLEFDNAIRVLQGVLNKLGTPLLIDGVLGPRTKQSALVACNIYQHEVLRNICLARKEFYRDLVDMNAQWSIYLTAWINRANSFLIA